MSRVKYCFAILGVIALLWGYVAFGDNTSTGHAPGLVGNVVHLWDGTVFRDWVDGNTGDGTTGNGIAACGLMGFDNTNWQALIVDSSGRIQIGTIVSALPQGNNNIGNVDIAAHGTAATVNAGNNAQAADFDIIAATANLRLLGVSIRESAATAAAATVVLRHSVLSGGNCTGDEIAYIELSANQSLQLQYQPRGLSVASGICADVIAGTVDLAVQTVAEAAP